MVWKIYLDIRHSTLPIIFICHSKRKINKLSIFSRSLDKPIKFDSNQISNINSSTYWYQYSFYFTGFWLLIYGLVSIAIEKETRIRRRHARKHTGISGEHFLPPSSYPATESHHCRVHKGEIDSVCHRRHRRFRFSWSLLICCFVVTFKILTFFAIQEAASKYLMDTVFSQMIAINCCRFKLRIWFNY